MMSADTEREYLNLINTCDALNCENAVNSDHRGYYSGPDELIATAFASNWRTKSTMYLFCSPRM
jgi:hypothetical protein